jgi:hypothetical protein
MPNPTRCVFCGSEANFRPITADKYEITCSRCGDYGLTGTVETILRDKPIQSRGAVSGWIRRQNAMGLTPRIDSDGVDHLRTLTKPPFRERVEQYLLAAAAKSQRLDQPLKPVTTDLIAISYSEDANDLAVLLSYLQEEGLMSNDMGATGERRLTPKGFIAADELRTRRAASSQAFVAMCFNEEMKLVYENSIDESIRSAGFQPMLISNKEHANKIDDEIIAEIRRSAFLVADFTEHRQNVYFETGFAIGLGLQVIWTCRKDHIKDLHFDIRQYNCIDWQHEAELATRLKLRIEALFGHGPIGTA